MMLKKEIKSRKLKQRLIIFVILILIRNSMQWFHFFSCFNTWQLWATTEERTFNTMST